MIYLVFLSIFTLSGITILLNKLLKTKICPVCAGVFLTWFWLLTLKIFNYRFDFSIMALLMGGSVVGIVYKLGEKIKSEKNLLIWKLVGVPLSFFAFYNLINFQWLWFGLLIFFNAIWFSFLKENPQNRQKIKEIEKKLKSCC